MSGTNYLLDINVVLYLLGGDKVLARIIGNKTPYLSFITEMELLCNQQMKASEEKQILNFWQNVSLLK